MPPRKKPRKEASNNENESDSESESESEGDPCPNTEDEAFINDNSSSSSFDEEYRSRKHKTKVDTKSGATTASSSSSSTFPAVPRRSARRPAATPHSYDSLSNAFFSDDDDDEETEGRLARARLRARKTQPNYQKIGYQVYALRRAREESLEMMGWVKVEKCSMRYAVHGRECWTHPSVYLLSDNSDSNSNNDPSDPVIHFDRPRHVPRIAGGGLIAFRSQARGTGVCPFGTRHDRWFLTRAGEKNTAVGKGMYRVSMKEREDHGLIQGVYDPNGVAEAHGQSPTVRSGGISTSTAYSFEEENQDRGIKTEPVTPPTATRSSSESKLRYHILSRSDVLRCGLVQSTNEKASSSILESSTSALSDLSSIQDEQERKSVHAGAIDGKLKHVRTLLDIYRQQIIGAKVADTDKEVHRLALDAQATSILSCSPPDVAVQADPVAVAASIPLNACRTTIVHASVQTMPTVDTAYEDDKARLKLAVAHENLHSAELQIHMLRRELKEKDDEVERKSKDVNTYGLSIKQKDEVIKLLRGMFVTEKHKIEVEMMKKDETTASAVQEATLAVSKLEEFKLMTVKKDEDARYSFNKQLNELRKQNGDLTADLAKKKREIKTLRADKAEYISKSAELVQNAETVKKDEKIREMATELRKIKAKLEDQAANLAEFRKTSELKDMQIKQKDAEIANLIAQGEGVAQQAKLSRKKTCETEETIRTLRLESAKVTEEKTDLAMELGRAKEANERLVKEKKRASEKVGDLLLEKDELAEEVKRSKAKLGI
ncbi:hypothetical protein IAT40_005936 [Kwoniella sp. CBS 6097]